MPLRTHVHGILVASTLLFACNVANAQIDLTSAKPNKEYFVKVPDGVELSTQEWGNPKGPTIIFIHGFLQSHLSWWKQVTDPALLKQFRMITFDIPGHGASSKPWNKSIYDNGAKWAEAVEAILNASGPQKPVMVGWSFGTRMIADYMQIHGDSRFAGIDFVDSCLSGNSKMLGPGIKVLKQTLVEDVAQNLKATRAFDRICFAKPPSKADMSQLTAISMMVPIKIRQWARHPAQYESVLKAITVPVLISHGTDDQVCTLAMAKYVAQTVPHAQTSYYKGDGHSSFWEDSARFNKELAAFVNKVTATQQGTAK